MLNPEKSTKDFIDRLNFDTIPRSLFLSGFYNICCRKFTGPCSVKNKNLQA